VEVAVSPVETLFKNLPLDLQREAEDFVLFLSHRYESTSAGRSKKPSWKTFLMETYGCMAKSPIRREDQGSLETRHELA